jgi:hypothetical protein
MQATSQTGIGLSSECVIFSNREIYSLDMFEIAQLQDALETLGALLAERHEPVGVLIVGGTSLLMLGVIEETSGDDL